MDTVDPNESLRLAASGNQDVRHQLVERIFKTLGLKAKSTNLLHDYRGASRPSVAIAVERPHDHKSSLYAAAYHGLLSDEPGQLIFHPSKHGKDWMHTIRLRGEPDKISQAFDQAGISQRHLIPIKDAQGGPEYRAVVYDKGGKYKPAMEGLARQVGGEVYTAPGFGLFLGGKDKKASHEAYRKAISKLSSNDQGMDRPKDENGMVKGSEAALAFRREAVRLRYSRPFEGEHAAMMSTLGDSDTHEADSGVVSDFLEDDNHPLASVLRGSSLGTHDQSKRPIDWQKTEHFPVQHGHLSILPLKKEPFQVALEGFLDQPSSWPGRTDVRGRQAFHKIIDQNELPEILHKIVNHHETIPEEERDTHITGAAKKAAELLKKLEPSRMSRRKYAQFSQNPQQSLNVSIPLPEAVEGTKASPQPSAVSGQQAQIAIPNASPQAMAAPQSVFRPMPASHATVLPYYDEGDNV